MKINEYFLTQNPCYRAGRTIQVKGLMLHSVGCPQPCAMNFVKNWNSAAQSRACVHAFIDGKNGEVYQTLPWNHRGWHAGGNANDSYIGVEMCEPSTIRYTRGAAFEITDMADAKEVVMKTYLSAVELFASLCIQFELNPLEDGVIISHSEGCKRGIASAHSDPEHLWYGIGSGLSMNVFRAAVAEKMKELENRSE